MFGLAVAACGCSRRTPERWIIPNDEYDTGGPLELTGWGKGGRVWADTTEWEAVCSGTESGSSCRTTGRATSDRIFIGPEDRYRSGQFPQPKWTVVAGKDRCLSEDRVPIN